MTHTSHVSSTEAIQEDLKHATAFLRDLFGKIEGPVNTGDLVRKGEAAAGLSRFSIQLAVWELISQGVLRLTPDWQVERAVTEKGAPQTQQS